MPVLWFRMKPRHLRYWLSSRVLLLCFVLPGIFSALPQQYIDLSADIELTGYRVGDVKAAADAKPRMFSVRCLAGKREWQVEHDWVQNSISTWFFDGTNVYRTSRIKQPISESMRELVARTTHLAEVPFDVAKSNLTINVWPSRDGHPMGDPVVNIVWLAFCSGRYLKEEGRLIPLPVEELRHTRDRFAYTDKTSTFADEDGLPRTVDLYLSKSQFLVSETEFDQQYFFGNRYTEWTRRTAAKLEEGAHMFHYAVTESTNFMGWNLPTKFEFSQEGRKFEQNGDWHWRGAGRVKSIAVGERPRGVFDPSMQQTIVDWRFRDAASEVDGILYTSTNTFLSATNDPDLQEKFAKQAAQVTQMKKRRTEAAPPVDK